MKRRGYVRRMTALRTIVLLLIALSASGAMAAKEIAPWREEYDKSVQRIDGGIEEQKAEIVAHYLQQLRRIQTDLQSQGQVRGAVAVFDELSRCNKARLIPTNVVPEPIELRDAQAQAIIQMQQTQYSNEMEIVRVSGRYLQALSQGRETMNARGDAEGVRTFDEERDRILALPRLRVALKATSGPPPDSLASAGGAKPAGITADLKYHSVKLSSSETEELTARMNFDVLAGLAEDDSKVNVRKSVLGASTTRSEDGATIYRTRFVVTARGEELPAGCRLVVAYYSRSLTEKERKRESTESLLLPSLERGQSYTVDGQGLTLYKASSSTTTTRGAQGMSMYGKEWYGMMVELLDQEGRVILKRFSPQSLERDIERDAAKASIN